MFRRSREHPPWSAWLLFGLLVPPITLVVSFLAMFAFCGTDERGKSEDGGGRWTPRPTDAPSTSERATVASDASPPLVASYVGRVVDAFGAPIAGASVTCESAPWLQALANTREGVLRTRSTRRTGADGGFVLSLAVGAPDVAITVAHADFPPLIAARFAGAARAGPHDLGDVRLRSGIGLSVYVTDAESGAAIRDARVAVEPTLIEPGKPPAYVEALTRAASADARGVVTFAAMAPGLFVLRAEADAHALCETTIEHGERPLTHKLALRRGYVLRGRVVAADARPIVDALVRVAAFDDAAPQLCGVAVARTSSSGDFRIPRLPAGSYRLTVASAEHGALAVESVVIPAETSLNLRMPSRSRIHGSLRSMPAAGVAAPQVADKLVQIRRTDEIAGAAVLPMVWEVRTGARGEFVFDDVPRGRFRLSVSSEVSTPMFAHLEFSVPRDAPLLVDASSAQRHVRGRLVDAAGNPVAGALVGAVGSEVDAARLVDFAAQLAGGDRDHERDDLGRAEGRSPLFARTDADGRFELAHPTDGHEFGGGDVDLEGSAFDPVPTGDAVPAGDPDTASNLEPAAKPDLTADSDPTRGPDPRGRSGGTAPTTSMRPRVARFRLWFAPPNGQSFCSEPWTVDLTDSTSPATDIGTVRCPADSTLHGRVTLPSGAPAVGVEVSIESVMPDPATPADRLDCRADVTGSFTFAAANLPAGNYRLSVVAAKVALPSPTRAAPTGPGAAQPVLASLRVDLPGDIGRPLTIQLP